MIKLHSKAKLLLVSLFMMSWLGYAGYNLVQNLLFLVSPTGFTTGELIHMKYSKGFNTVKYRYSVDGEDYTREAKKFLFVWGPRAQKTYEICYLKKDISKSIVTQFILPNICAYLLVSIIPLCFLVYFFMATLHLLPTAMQTVFDVRFSRDLRKRRLNLPEMDIQGKGDPSDIERK